MSRPRSDGFVKLVFPVKQKKLPPATAKLSGNSIRFNQRAAEVVKSMELINKDVDLYRSGNVIALAEGSTVRVVMNGQGSIFVKKNGMAEVIGAEVGTVYDVALENNMLILTPKEATNNV